MTPIAANAQASFWDRVAKPWSEEQRTLARDMRDAFDARSGAKLEAAANKLLKHDRAYVLAHAYRVIGQRWQEKHRPAASNMQRINRCEPVANAEFATRKSRTRLILRSIELAKAALNYDRPRCAVAVLEQAIMNVADIKQSRKLRLSAAHFLVEVLADLGSFAMARNWLSTPLLTELPDYHRATLLATIDFLQGKKVKYARWAAQIVKAGALLSVTSRWLESIVRKARHALIYELAGKSKLAAPLFCQVKHLPTWRPLASARCIQRE